MMHKAWCSIEEVPYCFSKSSILNQIRHFWTVTPVWIHQWLRNDVKTLKYHIRGAKFDCIDGFEMMHKAWGSIEEVRYCFPRSSIKFQDHTGWKNDYLNPYLRLLDRSQQSNPSDLPCFSAINLNSMQFCAKSYPSDNKMFYIAI